jgi:hypothetical protein
MMVKTLQQTCALLVAVLLSSFTEAELPTKPSFAPAFERVSRLRLFFGHQSVGENLLSGLQSLAHQHAQPLKIVQSEAADQAASGVWLHTMIGHNQDPASKLTHFVRLMDSGLAAQTDIAFFKFCFVDIDASTDINTLFELYRQTMADLQVRHPRTLFVHFTVPLTTVQSGWKASVKRVLGREVWGERENALREAYNEQLRHHYPSTLLFDLARHEATRADGATNTYHYEGRSVAALLSAYTDDAGHLNVLGQQRIATALLFFLSELDVDKTVAGN